jgi:hypothetical protein
MEASAGISIVSVLADDEINVFVALSDDGVSMPGPR